MKTRLIIGALMAMGCKNGEKAHLKTSDVAVKVSTVSIENTKWVINTLKGEDTPGKEVDAPVIYFVLNPKNKRITGHSGCNTFMGTYTLEEGKRISFSQIGSTRMACPDAKINESVILGVFEGADSFTISDNHLTLYSASNEVLAGFKKAGINKEPIVEKRWVLRTLGGKDIVMADQQEREIFFILAADENRITGFSGCNSLSGAYKLEKDNSIQFENIAVTMRACPDMDFNESEFLKVFELADHYTLDKDMLSLNMGRKAPLAVFEAVYVK
ncbi:META domain-containing protein [Mariniflexile ostreae]|uniref:META domain-containing protein n=1 Tax=Mariniflexile ostreae TaxID=1520892 RepID=A0ABV5FFM6_9FLAO